ncbi:MAG: MMPL family transporter [Gaiellaceae bacterium]
MRRISTESLARASARRPWRTVAAWAVAFVIAIGLVVVFLPSALTTEGEVLNDPESEQGYRLIEERLPPTGDPVTELVVVRSPTLTVGEPAFRRKIETLAQAIVALGVAPSVHTPFEPGRGEQISPDRHAALITIGMGEDAEDDIGRVVEVVESAGGGGFETEITGEWTADRDLVEVSNSDLEKGELQFGLPAALLILVLVFGAVVGALVPLLLAIVSIVVALALTAVLGQFFELSFFVVNMLTGMGLALGIDYALFVVSRYREERHNANEKLDAIAIAGATASRAVFFCGVAFVLAMFGMVLVPDTILRSLATGAILVGFVSVAAALTLLPAVLSLLGDRVNRLRVPVVGRRVAESAGGEGRFWSAVARLVMRRPLVSVLASVALLVAATAPVLDLNTGAAGIRSLPDRLPSKQGFNALERSFGIGTTDSVIVVVDGDARSAGVQAGVRRLSARLAADPTFRPPEVKTSPQRDLVVLESLVAGDSREGRAVEAVERLREVEVPAAFAGSGTRIYVTGETAELLDYRELTSRWLPIVFAFVLGLSFLLLTLAFRSIVVPAKAILLNLLSVGAAYGLLVLVFQKGVGNEIFGFQQADSIAAWLPLFLFSVLFGLSMDYHVFLLSRIRERSARTGDTRDAVAYGIGSTARLITGAALIIIAVFAGFASGELVEFQQMGFGVAVSLLIDATIIRSVLLPGSMVLLGERNWYLPRWLRWLPHLEVERAEPSGRP